MVPQIKSQELRGDLEILKTNDIKPNYSALAKEYGLDRHTVAKYWKEGGIRMSPIERETPFDTYFEEIKEKAESTCCTKKALYKYFQNKYGMDVFHCYSTFTHYLQRKEINQLPATKGWQLATCQGYALGWMNVLPNRINNYYPKELRILKDSL